MQMWEYPEPGLIAQDHFIHDFRDDYSLLREWGAVCRREFIWEPYWGILYRVVSAKHATPEAANEQARSMALEAGYREPRWYEFWRWSEDKLPPAEGG
jgi:hypothetical protein